MKRLFLIVTLAATILSVNTNVHAGFTSLLDWEVGNSFSTTDSGTLTAIEVDMFVDAYADGEFAEEDAGSATARAQVNSTIISVSVSAEIGEFDGDSKSLNDVFVGVYIEGYPCPRVATWELKVTGTTVDPDFEVYGYASLTW